LCKHDLFKKLLCSLQIVYGNNTVQSNPSDDFVYTMVVAVTPEQFYKFKVSISTKTVNTSGH